MLHREVVNVGIPFGSGLGLAIDPQKNDRHPMKLLLSKIALISKPQLCYQNLLESLISKQIMSPLDFRELRHNQRLGNRYSRTLIRERFTEVIINGQISRG